MRSRLRSNLTAAAVVAMTMTMTSVSAQEVVTSRALQQFEGQLTEYLELRWRVTVDLPLLDPALRLPEFIPVLEQHIRAVRRARANAGAGEVFAPELAPVLRTAIAATLEARCLSVQDLLAATAADAPVFLGPARVNDRRPWLREGVLPAFLVEALPPLPFGLGYRLVERDLVLLDVELGLVIDVLRQALPDGVRTVSGS
jgi:hypothetical protein